MAFSKSLLIKALAAGTALGGLGVAIHQRKNIASLFSKSEKAWGDLECGEKDGGECSIKQGGKILVKKEGSNSFEITTFGSGVIKLYKAEGYKGGFKFVIEDNDISDSSSNKLEQFETYEIELGEKDNTDEKLREKYYLLRKTDAKAGIKKALGLPNENCNLPNNSSSSQECDITTEKIGTIKFKEKTAKVSGTVKLIISTDSSKEEYPFGYKFSFKNTGDTDVNLTIGEETISLKKDSPVDFKIKKSEKGNEISLEKAWDLEDLVKKVGLKKEANGDYWTVGDSGLNVILNSTKKINKTKYGQPAGRVKVYTEQSNYNEGFKFTIEKGDIDLKESNNTGSATFSLGQFQSFEIVKEEGNWYLSKKEGDQSRIKDLLGLPCELPADTNPKECDISNDKINTIKFEGAGSGTVTSTGTPKLTIHKESGRYDYPLGYKFVFTSEGDSTITPPSSSTITLKQGVSIDYKIKISGANKDTLTLEKAFTADYLMDEASFDKSENAWTVGDKNLNIKQGTNKSSDVTGANPKNAKIRVYEGTPGYNQGMKFVVEDGDTNLSGGGMSKLSRYETYEVSVDNTDKQWYFTRKQTSSESVKERLGLPSDCTMPEANKTVDCTLNSEDKLKAIKFEGKGDEEKVSITDGNSLTLKICNTNNSSDGHGGYKFTLSSDKTVTIPQNGSSAITINANESTEFKIKESQGKLTLEKKSN